MIAKGEAVTDAGQKYSFESDLAKFKVSVKKTDEDDK